MRAALALPEQRTLLQNVSWETYERLLSDQPGAATPHFNFDRGALEIMSPSSEHEEYKQALTLLVEMLAERAGVDIRSLGSTTFKRGDLGRGFEADASFYVQSAGKVEGKAHIDAAHDPAPDLVIEIEITAPALDKLPIYAGFGVPEVWRFDAKRLSILHLHGADYEERPESHVFGKVTSEDLSRLAVRSLVLRRTEWLREVRAWLAALH